MIGNGFNWHQPSVIAIAVALAALPSALQAQAAPDAPPASNSPAIEDIIVTGSRLGITGFAAPTPVTVLNAAAIAERAPANILDVINQIPSAKPTRSATGSSRNAASQDGIQGLIDLRGLGTARTLTLVDGQRVVPGGQSGAVDTNMIPVGLIDRMDIVTGGASAAYGSDAVAGVANIIIKDRMKGVSVSIQKGVSNYGDGLQTIASIAGGLSSKDGRLRLVAGADYAQNSGTDAVYARSYGAVENGLLGTGAVGSATRPAGTAAQVWSTNVERNDVTPGGLISTGPLAGTAFTESGTPYQFQRGTSYGTSMTGSTANYGYAPQGFYKYINPYKRLATYAKLSFDVSDALTLYATGAYGWSRMDQYGSSPLTISATVGLNNPYLPAATRQAMIDAGVQTITVGKVMTTLGTGASSQGKQINEMLRGSVGAKGKFGGSWSWDAYYSQGRTDQHVTLYYSPYSANIAAATNAVRAPDGSITCGPLPAGAQSGCVPFNIFGVQSYGSNQAAYNYMFQPTAFRIVADQKAAGANLRGKPFATWAGDVTIAAGGEFREDKLRQEASALAQVLPAVVSAGTAYPYSGANRVVEGYAEVGVPLAKDAGPFLKSLDIDAAGRVTHYRYGGTVETWKAGATWDINDAIRIRGTRSRDIRAASVYELFGNQSPLPATQISNPLNGQIGNASSSTVGNTFLRPEAADTITAGIVFKPEGIFHGLKMSVDYFDITVKNIIAAVTAQDVVNGCQINHIAAYCAQIQFDPTVALGIKSVNSTYDNLNKLYTNGLDFEVSYRLPSIAKIPGAFDIRFLGTWTPNSSLTTSTGTVNYAGSGITAAAGGGVPKFRGTLNLDYTGQRFGTQFQFTGFTPLLYNPTLIGPDNSAYNANLSNSISQNKFAGRVYLNWSGHVDIGGDQKIGSVFWVVNNVFNRQPPQYANLAFSFGAANYYDVVGRYFQLGLRAQFK